jgi:hypothetical protein
MTTRDTLSAISTASGAVVAVFALHGMHWLVRVAIVGVAALVLLVNLLFWLKPVHQKDVGFDVPPARPHFLWRAAVLLLSVVFCITAMHYVRIAHSVRIDYPDQVNARAKTIVLRATWISVPEYPISLPPFIPCRPSSASGTVPVNEDWSGPRRALRLRQFRAPGEVRVRCGVSFPVQSIRPPADVADIELLHEGDIKKFDNLAVLIGAFTCACLCLVLWYSSFRSR